MKLRSPSSKKDTKRSSNKSKNAATKKAAAQAESEHAESQAKNENAAEAKNENTEAEAEEVEGTCTGTMVNDGVEATAEAGEEHPEISTVNEESGHIVGEEHHARCALSLKEAGSIVLHVSSDMNEKEKRR